MIIDGTSGEFYVHLDRNFHWIAHLITLALIALTAYFISCMFKTIRYKIVETYNKEKKLA